MSAGDDLSFRDKWRRPFEPRSCSTYYSNANGWEVSWHNGRWYVHHDSGRTVGAFPTAREAFDAASRAMMERQR